MAAYLIYSNGDPHDNCTGRNSVIACGANEAAARAAAIAAAPTGEDRVPAAWLALLLATTEHANLADVGGGVGVVWIEGHTVQPLRRSHGE